MSKIGEKPIQVPDGAIVAITEDEILVKSSKGEMRIARLPGVAAMMENGSIVFSLTGRGKQARSNWGTLRALVQNAVQGLTRGFQKTLLLEGVGFRIAKEGNSLSMNLGFSHPVRYSIPAGVALEVEKNSLIKISGFDRALVGQVAAEIRALRKPEPYKGTGFRYSDEVIRRKAGKKTVAGAGTVAK